VSPAEIFDRLQIQPDDHRWALNDYNLLFAVFSDRQVARTRKMQLLKALIEFTQSIGVLWGFIYFVGFVELLKLLILQFFVADPSGKNNISPVSFFVGFGVAKEEELYSYYKSTRLGDVEKLHQYKVNTFGKWHHVGLLTGRRTLANALNVAKEVVLGLPSELDCRRIDFLIHIATKIGYYAFVRSWFSILQLKSDSKITEVAFSCQNIAAFAAVDAGIRTIYFSHGMITRCELLPSFDAVTTLSAEEAVFVKSRLPRSHVFVYSQNGTNIINRSAMTRQVLIASCPVGSDRRYMLGIVPFLHWAKKNCIPVRVRLHPSEQIDFFWADFVRSGLVTVEEKGHDFHSAIIRLKPRLMISWVSTTLSDVLRYGILPVTACRDDDYRVSELVYPIFDRCLRLPSELETLGMLLDDDVLYETVLSSLCGL
jgi:hypothetical protein